MPGQKKEFESRLRARKRDKEDGEIYYWLAKTRGEWWDEIRLKDKQVYRAMKILIGKGLIKTQYHRYKGLRTTHIRILKTNFLASYDNLFHQSQDNSKELIQKRVRSKKADKNTVRLINPTDKIKKSDRNDYLVLPLTETINRDSNKDFNLQLTVTPSQEGHSVVLGSKGKEEISSLDTEVQNTVENTVVSDYDVPIKRLLRTRKKTMNLSRTYQRLITHAQGKDEYNGRQYGEDGKQEMNVARRSLRSLFNRGFFEQEIMVMIDNADKHQKNWGWKWISMDEAENYREEVESNEKR